MRKSIVGALAALAIAGAGSGVLIANAQPTTPSGDPPSHDGPPWMGGMHRGQHWREMHGHGPAGTFALVYRQQDRQLSPSDVQKIAEGFLLWNGNHMWKVTEVASAPDGAIGFALATPEGSIVARFTMDPHNGRVTRTG
jgi:hypothetical protein